MTTVFLVLMLSSCTTVFPRLSQGEREALAGAGAKVELLDGLVNDPNNGKIDAMLIYRGQTLVLERGSNNPHDLRSSTKAITALLAGLAVDQGLIRTDQSILDFFPERAVQHPEFQNIRVEDLLTMRSGLNSDDWDPSSPGNEEVMYQKKSWVDFFFSLKVVDKPGERFRYSTAGVVVLGEIIARASGMSFDQYAAVLFHKLGIQEFAFARTPVGEVDAGGHLRLRPTDFAKIGLLAVNKGNWRGESLISTGWIEKMLVPATLTTGAPKTGPYMGYLWWQEPVVDGVVRSYQARGNGGQYLIAITSENLLVVFVGSAYNEPLQMQPFFLMKTYIIPAWGPQS